VRCILAALLTEGITVNLDLCRHCYRLAAHANVERLHLYIKKHKEKISSIHYFGSFEVMVKDFSGLLVVPEWGALLPYIHLVLRDLLV
jgi:hypothetical protein